MIKNKFKKRILQEISYATGKYFVIPEIVNLTITYQCNFRCNSCTVWRMDKYPELAGENWRKVVLQLKKTLSKNTSIELSGGEPLLRKDLTYSTIKQLRTFFANVGINSNGSLLDEETVIALKKSGITFSKISLYSITDSIHDALRGITGAAEHAKSAIELLRQHDIKTDIGVLITSKNISSIPTLLEYYNQPQYAAVNIVLQPLDEPIGLPPISGKNKIETIENLWPDEKSVNELFSLLNKNRQLKVKNSEASLRAIQQYYLDQKSALKRRCLAGQRSLVVYPDGNISLCFKGATIGNIAKESLKDILSSKASIQQRLNIKKCNKHCRVIGCNFSKTIPEIIGLH
ncbi:MAG: Glycosyl transferase family 2 [Candidatus Moranbacteria bacterium GW2011_GWC2_37_73]|nr:MAG: hypothetical protein UR95_C0004G0035 [Parcubacteria group bacterium GW2011_GWC1_36_108]KKQ30163.1 MAG: Glycosyl transferase family 2 [Candidatus Moranbacteria bacterium GW2011_GWE1_37_24]KKQ38874.1 MAG: Glycosyl transferase family 2 [Candidatus Moranbacteria bacterium GW2011_GWC2_37_73]HBU11112.1 hypothetical protein [Candidatus Moranbacteria bacterium]